MRNNKKISFVILASLLAITSLVLAGTPIIKRWNKKDVKKTEQNTEAPDSENGKKDPVQLALINELGSWLAPFDSTNNEYYMGGFFSAIDRTDSAHAMENLDYRFCRSGNQFYTRMGQTETINTDKLYLSVDHEAKRIIVTNAKQAIHGGIASVKEMYNYAKEESYTLVKKKERGLTVISLLNPTHIACKEFSVSYDSLNRKVAKFFIRQADVMDHMNADMEKWVTLVVTKWDETPDPASYINTGKFVIQQQGEWHCTALYKDYELMVR